MAQGNDLGSPDGGIGTSGNRMISERYPLGTGDAPNPGPAILSGAGGAGSSGGQTTNDTGYLLSGVPAVKPGVSGSIAADNAFTNSMVDPRADLQHFLIGGPDNE